jgi:hypothetical protein
MSSSFNVGEALLQGYDSLKLVDGTTGPHPELDGLTDEHAIMVECLCDKMQLHGYSPRDIGRVVSQVMCDYQDSRIIEQAEPEDFYGQGR